MSKSYDLRIQTVNYIRSGGSKTEASRLFGVTRRTIYNWLGMGGDVRQKKKPGPKGSRKVDEVSLKKAVASRDDARLSELARHFRVHPSTVSRILKRLKVTRKKNVALRRSQEI